MYPATHPEYNALNTALSKIEHIAEHVNESKRQVENMSKLLDIQNRLHNSDSFVVFSPTRRLLKEGMLKRVRNNNTNDCIEQLIFLFNDVILYTDTNFHMNGCVNLDTLQLIPADVNNNNTTTIELIDKGRSNTLTFICSSSIEYQDWQRFFSAAIQQSKLLDAQSAHRRSISSGVTNQMLTTHKTNNSVDMHDLGI